jgi:hypothetical protein
MSLDDELAKVDRKYQEKIWDLRRARFFRSLRSGKWSKNVKFKPPPKRQIVVPVLAGLVALVGLWWLGIFL